MSEPISIQVGSDTTPIGLSFPAPRQNGPFEVDIDNGTGMIQIEFPTSASIGQTWMFSCSFPGVLVTGFGVQPFVATRDMTIISMQAACYEAPTGGPVIFDFNINGVTVFTDQTKRVRIPAGQVIGSIYVPDIVLIPKGSVVTTDVDAVGTLTPGSNATIVCEVR